METPVSPIDIIKKQPVVGMFGTCGDTTFRQDLFIPEYERQQIDYYNPQVPAGTWDPSMAKVEALHLALDAVQLWPVTRDTYGLGSLAETGYSLSSSMSARTPWPKFIIAMIEQQLADHLTDPVAREESLRARKLVAAHLEKQDVPTLVIVDSLQEMLDKSILLARAATLAIEAVKGGSYYNRFVQEYGNAAIIAAIQSGYFGQEAAKVLNQNR